MRREEFRKRWLSPLAVRFRGFNPEGLFAAIYPFVCLFMLRMAPVCGCLFIFCAWADGGANAHVRGTVAGLPRLLHSDEYTVAHERWPS